LVVLEDRVRCDGHRSLPSVEVAFEQLSADEFGAPARSFETMGDSAIVLDADLVGEPDLRAIDLLARLQLAARRAGLELRLRNATDELLELVAFAGLADVLRLEAGGQPEEREERLGVEEERELDDPAL